jgi:hypothetical protein
MATIPVGSRWDPNWRFNISRYTGATADNPYGIGDYDPLQTVGAFEGYDPGLQFNTVTSALGWGNGRSGNPYLDYLRKNMGENIALYQLREQARGDTGNPADASRYGLQSMASWLGERLVKGSTGQDITQGGQNYQGYTPLQLLQQVAAHADMGNIDKSQQIATVTSVLGSRLGPTGKRFLQDRLTRLYDEFTDATAADPTVGAAGNNFYEYALKKFGVWDPNVTTGTPDVYNPGVNPGPSQPVMTTGAPVGGDTIWPGSPQA